MIDIISAHAGLDLGVADTQTSKAANILSVQFGALEYAQDLGIDLDFFLSDSFQFQNDSFKAYCIQTLASWGVNVSSVVDTVESLSRQYTFKISPDQSGAGLIAR